MGAEVERRRGRDATLRSAIPPAVASDWKGAEEAVCRKQQRLCEEEEGRQ